MNVKIDLFYCIVLVLEIIRFFSCILRSGSFFIRKIMRMSDSAVTAIGRVPELDDGVIVDEKRWFRSRRNLSCFIGI